MTTLKFDLCALLDAAIAQQSGPSLRALVKAMGEQDWGHLYPFRKRLADALQNGQISLKMRDILR